MKTILVLTDYSDCARNATNYACKLAQKMEADLVLYHSFFLPPPDQETPLELPSSEELIAENTAILEGIGRQITDVYGVKVRVYTNYLPIVQDLQSIIKRYHADLVIMGRKKASDWEYKLFGSTAASLIGYCPCPLLIVPDDVRYQSVSKILFAFDASSITHKRKLSFVSQLALVFQAHVRVLHVELPEDAHTEIVMKKSINLEAFFYGTKHSYEYINSENIIAGIEEGISEYRPDILIMVSQVHGFWHILLKKSKSRTMVFHTRVPLLIIPD